MTWSGYTNFKVFKMNSGVKSTSIGNLRVASYFRGFMLDEWEVCLYTIVPSLPEINMPKMYAAITWTLLLSGMWVCIGTKKALFKWDWNVWSTFVVNHFGLNNQHDWGDKWPLNELESLHFNENKIFICTLKFMPQFVIGKVWSSWSSCTNHVSYPTRSGCIDKGIHRRHIYLTLVCAIRSPLWISRLFTHAN